MKFFKYYILTILKIHNISNMLPSDFDWEMYLLLNDDVKREFPSKEKAITHYIKNGIKEKRLYKMLNIPKDFDWEYYLILNSDVYTCFNNRLGSFHHYETFGYKENRKYKKSDCDIPVNFHWIIYSYYNPSLKNISNNIAAHIHYISEGKEQNLQYMYLKSEIPEDFVWECYIEINPDLKKIYNTQTLSEFHYIAYGIHEKRLYKLKLTPEDFDIKTYIELNPGIHHTYKINEYTIKIHYEIFGHVHKLLYKLDKSNVPDDFNWERYLEFNPDLKKVCNSELLATQHYNNYGIYQNRSFIKHTTINSGCFTNYPFLFHKYLLNICPESTKVNYEIIFENEFVKPGIIIAHLHCYNINNFNDFYTDEYMVPITENCSHIIITYCTGSNIVDLPKTNTTCIKNENRGMDIGGKYACIDYLKVNEYEYDSILFLHSKTDDYVRRLYWDPLIHNIASISQDILENKNNIGVYVPPLIYMGDFGAILYKDNFVNPKNVISKWNFGNSLYLNDIDRYFNYDQNNFIFPEGNCFITKREIAEELYGNVMCYNLLNNNFSMDAVWVKSLYSNRGFKTGNTITEIYDFFKKNVHHEYIHPNNIAWGAGHAGHADNMYEHSFERIIFKVVQKYGMSIKVIPSKPDTDAIYNKQLDSLNNYINAYIHPVIDIQPSTLSTD